MLKVLGESTKENNNDQIGESVFRTGTKKRLFVQQINEETDLAVAHFIISDINVITEVLDQEDNLRKIVDQTSETVVFAANGTGQIVHATPVVALDTSDIGTVITMLEEHLGDEFDELPF